MKQNFIFEPSRSHQEQHMLPVSPQNFDPFDKTRDQNAYKKTIFSTSMKPKASYESIFELDSHPYKPEDPSGEADLKKVLSKEMRAHLESLKSELLETFTALLKDSKLTGKVSNEEVQEIKRQILYNKNKFEEIQEHIAHVSQQYNDISSFYAREAESMKNSNSFSGIPRNDRFLDHSMASDNQQKQLEMQFKTLKQGLLNEVQNALKAKGKSRLNDDVVGEMKQIKYSFETDLKQNFEMINGRVKRAEENLNEIMRKKRDYMDAIRDQFLTSINHQENSLGQEIKLLENVVRSKCEQTQAKAIVSGEINKRMDLFRTEIDSLRKAISSNNEEMERVETLVTKKLENLDFDMKRQFFEFQSLSQKSSNSQQNQELFERRLQKLNGDSENYHKTIQQLKGQVEEVTKIHKQLQSQAATSTSQGIISRLEEKIAALQGHISDLEAQVAQQKMNNISQSTTALKSERSPQTHRQSEQLLKGYGFESLNNSTTGFLENQQRIQSSRVHNEELLKNHEDLMYQRTRSQPTETKKNSPPRLNENQYLTDLISQPQSVRTEVNYYTDPNTKKTQKSLTDLSSKKLKHAKILAQINYFINGTQSNLLDDEEDAEICCNLDDDGYIFDEDGDFVLDQFGFKIKLTPEQIDRFNNNNMIE